MLVDTRRCGRYGHCVLVDSRRQSRHKYCVTVLVDIRRQSGHEHCVTVCLWTLGGRVGMNIVSLCL